MISKLIRRIASCGSPITLSLFVILGSVTASLPLLAQGTPEPLDQGPTNASVIVTASLVLKAKHPDSLEAYVESTQDPNSSSYHRFLSLPAFVYNFSPGPREIFLITRYLEYFGIQVTDVYADHLVIKATGTVDAFNKAFSLNVHDFSHHGKRFHRPLHQPQIPFFLRDILVTIIGPSDEARFRPRNLRVNDRIKSALLQKGPVLPHNSTATGVPGDYTVGDVANLYHINPLYKAHIDGRGQTVGIATLANFLPADAYTYWSLIGLPVLPNRITQVHVDGGGVLSGDAGSGETSLDVEQSGGLAPGAKIIVYDAPNTDPGFIDLFYKAASDNLVDSLSVSWGLAEVYYFQVLAGQDLTGELHAFHQAFLELAAQGISTFASAGDNGAYDANGGVDMDVVGGSLKNVLSVGSPSSDPAITAAGGTTTPVELQFVAIPPPAPPLIVSKEQVWGWDYLQKYFLQVGGLQILDQVFPAGGGGGVSIFWPLPAYQSHTFGIRRSEAGQSIVVNNVDLLDLPAHFEGRNVPDVSLNADPESGYLLYSTTDGGLLDQIGGTSFVAPQLNGISALLSQANCGKRLGLWNPMLYRFKRIYGHSCESPFVDITAGDNWFYHGIPGYEPGAGLGVLDVTKLAFAILRDGH